MSSDEELTRRRLEKSTRNRSPHETDNRYKKPEYKLVKKEYVNIRITGALAEDTNMFKGVKIVYNEPAEAEKSTEKWRLYTFKGKEILDTIYLHRQSGFLIGKDQKICEITMLHPSISKQHAVFQFRRVGDEIKPYIIDLKSTNGTYINNLKIEPQRYIELRKGDILKFGFSTREYVLVNENIDNEELD